MPKTAENKKLNKKKKINPPILKAENTKLKVAKLPKETFFTKAFGKDSEEEKEIQVAKEVVKAQKSKKKQFISIGFFFINIIVIVCILLFQMKDGIVENPGELSLNWWFLLATIGVFLIIVIAETLRFNVLIRKATGFNRIGLSYKIGLLGKYYDVITPFSTGGQPFQIYYANKYGIKGGEAFSIVMSKYMFQQISYILIATSVLVGVLTTHGGITNILISATGVGEAEARIVATMAWVGYAVVGLLLLVIIITILNKRVGTALVVFCIKIFCKIFRKNYDKLFRKAMRTVNTWQTTIRRYKKSPWVWIANILLSIIFYTALFSIPYFIYCAFMGWNASVWLEIIIFTILIELAASYNPLPGGTGVSDLSFLAIFSSLFDAKVTFWALLLWKFFTYYIFIIRGLCMLSYDFFIGNRRLEKNKEKWSKLRYNKIKVKNSLY